MSGVKPRCVNILIVGVVLLVVDSCYLTYHSTLTNLDDLTGHDGFSVSVFDFWQYYFFESFGGIILLMAMACFLLGFFCIYREQSKLEKVSRQAVARFMEELDSGK